MASQPSETTTSLLLSTSSTISHPHKGHSTVVVSYFSLGNVYAGVAKCVDLLGTSLMGNHYTSVIQWTNIDTPYLGRSWINLHHSNFSNGFTTYLSDIWIFLDERYIYISYISQHPQLHPPCRTLNLQTLPKSYSNETYTYKSLARPIAIACHSRKKKSHGKLAGFWDTLRTSSLPGSPKVCWNVGHPGCRNWRATAV